MTRQLTREQLEFARSIGATRYLEGGAWIDESTPGFFYTHHHAWDGRRWVESHCTNTCSEFHVIDFSPLDEPEVDYVPKVGEECEMYTNEHGWIEAKYVGKDGESPVYRLKEPSARGIEAVYMVCIGCKFRPLPDPEQQRRDELLSKWQSCSLDNAHDTEASVLTVGEMIDFIVELEGE